MDTVTGSPGQRQTSAGSAQPHAVSLLLFAAFWTSLAAYGFATTGESLLRQRLRDLGTIRAALNSYQAANGSYPKASAARIGDDPDLAHWLPGLAPTFLATVPRDPRGLPEPNKQYLYMSDGVDFKIVAHGSEDAGWVTKRRPDLVDPRRPGLAYGFWTAGAATW